MWFATPLLLVGLLAAGIPFLLHLLSSVRAREVLFPSLRFLRQSMEKTARRRKIQHWLLLVLRSLLLAVLAIAVAELFTQGMGGWLAGKQTAAVVLLDNSYSMSVRSGRGDDQPTALDAARNAALTLLDADQPDRPARSAVAATTGGQSPTAPAADATAQAENLAATKIDYGRPALAERVDRAVQRLEDDTSAGRRALYVFGDLQRGDYESLAKLPSLRKAKDVHLFVVDAVGAEARNVGVVGLELSPGPYVVDEEIVVTATLANSSSQDQRVRVSLEVLGRPRGRAEILDLGAAGSKTATQKLAFRVRPDRPGAFYGAVRIDTEDDLPVDNIRRFAVTVGRRVRAWLVRGPAERVPAIDPVAAIHLMMTPQRAPWPVQVRIVENADFAAQPSDPGVWQASLKNVAALVFCEVPSFTKAQAAVIRAFARRGGTVVFFLGPQSDRDNYNRLFGPAAGDDALLDAAIAPAVGQVGPEAAARPVTHVRVRHPWLVGLYDNEADYFRWPAMVQRYYRLSGQVNREHVLLALDNGDPLLVVRPAGAGRVVLCTTTSSFKWTSLPVSPVFLPILKRAVLAGRGEVGADNAFVVGAPATLSLPRGLAAGAADSSASPTRPAGEAPPADVEATVTRIEANGDGPRDVGRVAMKVDGDRWVGRFAATDTPGAYEWTARGPMGDVVGMGVFVVNAAGEEGRLERIPPEQLRQAFAAAGLHRAYVGRSLADVHQQARQDAIGVNWWAPLAALAVFLLVVEALVANRRKAGPAVPAHLNPRLAGEALEGAES